MDFKKKVEELLSRLETEKGLTRRMVEKRLGYAKNYIDQALSKNGNQKLVNKLQALLDAPETVDYDIGKAIRKIEATNDVMLSAIGELLARDSSMTVTTVQKQLETLVNERLKTLEF